LDSGKSNSQYFQEKLRELHKEDLYRELRTIEEISESGKGTNASTVINFSSNDYLGLSKNTFLLRKLKNLHISRISVPSDLEPLNRITVDSQKTTIFFFDDI